MEQTAKKNNLVEFLKGSSILVISSMCLKAMNFFLLPLYTKYLPAESLGISDSVTNLTGLILPLFTLGLESAFSAFYFEKAEPERGKKVFSTLSTMFLLLGLLAASMSVFAKPLSELLFNGPQYQSIVVMAFGSLAINLWYLPYSLELRMQNRMLAFGIANIAASLSMILLNILFVAVLQMKEQALILSSLLSNGLQLLILFLFVRQVPKRADMDKKLLKDMLKFSLPLVPMSVLNWVLAISDRYVLLACHGESVVGIYGIAMRFVTVLNVLISAVAMAYTTFAFQTREEEGAKRKYYYVFQTESLLLLGMCFTISFFGKEVIQLMSSDPEYYAAAEPLRDLLFAQAIYAMSNVVGYGINFAKRSVYYLLSVSAGVALNLGLNLILIPEYGMKAAALTTLLGYLLVFLMVYHFSEKLYPCNYGVLRVAIVAVVLYGLCFFLEETELWIRAIVWVAAAAGTVFVFRDTLKQLGAFFLHRVLKK